MASPVRPVLAPKHLYPRSVGREKLPTSSAPSLSLTDVAARDKLLNALLGASVAGAQLACVSDKIAKSAGETLTSSLASVWLLTLTQRSISVTLLPRMYAAKHVLAIITLRQACVDASHGASCADAKDVGPAREMATATAE